MRRAAGVRVRRIALVKSALGQIPVGLLAGLAVRQPLTRSCPASSTIL
jgi:hypothetical protein